MFSLNFFKRKKDIKEPVKESELEFFIDTDHYEKSDYNQLKYKVYFHKNDKYYYLGDIRRFDKSLSNDKLPSEVVNKAISYLELNKITQVSEPDSVRRLNEEELDILNKELDRLKISANLMDDSPTFREYLKSL